MWKGTNQCNTNENYECGPPMEVKQFESKLSNMYKPNSYWPIIEIRSLDNTQFPKLRCVIYLWLFDLRLGYVHSDERYDLWCTNRKTEKNTFCYLNSSNYAWGFDEWLTLYTVGEGKEIEKRKISKKNKTTLQHLDYS